MEQPTRLQDTVRAVKRWFQRKPPEDPYASVGAPKKPKPPHLRAAAKAERPEPYAQD
jgi:hypothetical protein